MANFLPQGTPFMITSQGTPLHWLINMFIAWVQLPVILLNYFYPLRGQNYIFVCWVWSQHLCVCMRKGHHMKILKKRRVSDNFSFQLSVTAPLSHNSSSSSDAWVKLKALATYILSHARVLHLLFFLLMKTCTHFVHSDYMWMKSHLQRKAQMLKWEIVLELYSTVWSAEIKTDGPVWGVRNN